MSDERTPNQARGKTKLSNAMAVFKELRAYDEAGRQILAKFNIPIGVLAGEAESYASAKAARRAWDEYNFPSK